MTELLARLSDAIGAQYRISRELGGGGMSRVFLVDEVELGRQVVVKVLPPEMGAGVNIERFRREILLAASLQHPHIVPLLSAGASGDLLYYVMPYIEGESLRDKLEREGELPVGEVVRILREVVDALEYAHSRGIVHRDIKPENIMLARKHALVTDFGVAKAVAESGASSLTSMGVALGTPAYMAPEQASADPHTDHRADIYAVGVMAYEMLCGRPPFVGSNPQTVLAAHVTQSPDPIHLHRQTVPDGLQQIIMRCLEKRAADRWQTAEDLSPQLETYGVTSGGITPTGTRPTEAVAVRTANPMRIALLFGLASAAVLALVFLAIRLIGLPDWVLLAAAILLAAGLPIMLLTGHVERRRDTLSTSSAARRGWQGWFTWRRAILGGVVAFIVLALGVGGYMTMRSMGIGPVGTLMASGAIGDQDRLVLADFVNRTSDASLGRSVTEALRIDLAQSP
ncbi:MAG: serine/threonine-protein kinase, partial [Gemmatimonadales bacterium]